MAGLQIFAILPSGEPRRLETPRGASDAHELDVPDGIYEAMRTFQGNRFLRLERHLARASAGMAELGWSEPLDEAAVRRALHATTSAFPGDSRVRLDIFERARPVLGASTRMLLALAPFTPVPRDAREHGVRVGVARGVGRRSPHIKRNEWIARRRGSGPGDRGFFEHLLLDEHGRILEGSSSNVFAVRAGVLMTAPADVLGGIQRGIFLELARERRIPVLLEPVPLADVAALDEMFLTSSTRGGVPIVEVEGRAVGSGKPGPLFRKLAADYEALAVEARPALEEAGAASYS